MYGHPAHLCAMRIAGIQGAIEHYGFELKRLERKGNNGTKLSRKEHQTVQRHKERMQDLSDELSFLQGEENA